MAQMVQLCMLAQISSAQERMPQTEHFPSEVEEECHTQVCSTQSPSEGLAHPPSLESRPPPHLQDASVPALGPVPMVTQLS